MNDGLQGWLKAQSLYLNFVFFTFLPTEVMVKVHVVDLKTETIALPISVRAYLNQSITEFKQLIAQVSSSFPFILLFSFNLVYMCISINYTTI